MTEAQFAREFIEMVTDGGVPGFQTVPAEGEMVIMSLYGERPRAWWLRPDLDGAREGFVMAREVPVHGQVPKLDLQDYNASIASQDLGDP